MKSYSYRLPFPPSINTYYRRGPKYQYISPAGRKFRTDVCDAVVIRRNMRGRLAVHIELIAPTRRKYDVDNRIKATLDALQHAGVFEDDEQIDELRVKRLHVEPPGACDVTITQLT